MTQAPELLTRSRAVKSIEIFAPDRHSTLRPPPTGGGWVVGLLSLVRRWLEIARLPWATVH
jgi:hypothetical protein